MESTEPAPRPYEPSRILRWLYSRWFSHITVDEAWSGVVRDSASRGVVVYVMRSLSFLDFLCLDYLVKRFALPLVRFVNDLGLWILEPFGKGGRRLRLKRARPEAEELAEVVEQEHSALLFLRRPPKIGSTKRGEELEVDLIRTLVETQRRLDKPILLVPQTFVWSQRPPKARRGIVDLFFGPVEWPGKIRVFFQFLFNYRNAKLRSGEPFDLHAFVESNLELTDAEVADKVRYALLRRMERERTVVLGPTMKTPLRIRDELLRSPRVRKQIADEARRTGKSEAKIERMARKELRKLQAVQTPTMLAMLSRVLGWVFSRIYDGVVVDQEGLDRVRDAAREGTLIYLPSHKSHVDYLVLSDVLFKHALSPPLIAAGENLSFFPLGPILRRGGAFFIRRSFKGRKLYSALVDAYMRKLMVEGFPIEFFIEGGRSRTGKLLAPKYGLLTMVVDAALKLKTKKVFFVPTSIGYERIIEERSYVHELGGGEKKKEDLGGLLKTPQILRSKYGRLYVQFGEILSFDAAVAAIEGEITPPKRRALIQQIAHRTTYQIDRATVVTPAALVATALLVHRRRGITRRHLQERSEMLLRALQRMGARVAKSLLDANGRFRRDTLDEAIALFLDAKLLKSADATGDEPIYNVPDQRRIALEYYKNNVLNFFVPSAMIGAAMSAMRDDSPKVDALRDRVRWLSRLFKYEFMYRADAPFDVVFGDALASMVAAGEVEWVGDHVRLGESGRHLDVYAQMLRSYFEAYLLAARAAAQLEGSEPRKDFVRRAMGRGQRMFLAGEIESREAINQLKLESALQSFRDQGWLKFGDKETVMLADEDVDLTAIARDLEDYL